VGLAFVGLRKNEMDGDCRYIKNCAPSRSDRESSAEGEEERTR